MRLIGFADDVAARVTESFKAIGCDASRAEDRPCDLLPNEMVFVSGDYRNFAMIIRELRESGKNIHIAVLTQVPSVEKWLDGLEAGANDYYSLPLDGRQLRLLFQCGMELPSRCTENVAAA